MIYDRQDLWKIMLYKKQQVTVYCPYPNPGVKGKGQQMNGNNSVTLSDHVDRFGRSPAALVPIKCVPGGCTPP